jgi:threonine dehydrogenase-like Zn-dependent dehydrogenase
VRIPGDKLDNLYRLPASLDYTTAATLEPFCNPVHSFHLQEPKNNETVAVFGAGGERFSDTERFNAVGKDCADHRI